MGMLNRVYNEIDGIKQPLIPPGFLEECPVRRMASVSVAIPP